MTVGPRTFGEEHLCHRYDKKFAFLPVRSIDNGWIWLCTYYEKYTIFSYKEMDDIVYLQGRLTAEGAVIDKLIEGF